MKNGIANILMGTINGFASPEAIVEAVFIELEILGIDLEVPK